MGTDRTAFGSSKNGRAAKRESARDERRTARQGRQSVDLQVLDCALLLEALEVVTAAEGALRIGLSRDKGAFAFGVYGDGEPYTEYVGATEDVNDYLRQFIEYWRSLND